MHKDRSRFGARAMLALATLGLVSAAFPAAAQQRPVSLRDSVPIGSNGLCEAQIQSPRAGDGLFDRRYLVSVAMLRLPSAACTFLAMPSFRRPCKP